MTGLPWSQCSTDASDLDRARRILDDDHYDLEKIKARIIEFLAVKTLKKTMKGPILCFVGPPGVGKTSLGRSIARALDRKFIRLSLGGVRDEAEIRGHRRTYVGALPGRIIQGISQAGTSNPVFMLDEIDKLGADYRGDPSSALLEVLDPEQNSTFRDHYLGVPYDLSRVLFVATANVLDPIQPAFLDRMEVISLSGYTEGEKLQIARQHLIPKQLEENGVTDASIEYTTAGLRHIIEGYTREAGLRNLEREIGSVARKVAVAVARGKKRKVRITPTAVSECWTRSAWRRASPGAPVRRRPLRRGEHGEGKGVSLLTGMLGAVMKESAQAADARRPAEELSIPDDYFENATSRARPAIPKDGPSAGITMATAAISACRGGRFPRTSP
jgi:ATP-dependent Lon protease